MPTVMVEQLSEYAIKMVWSKQVVVEDVKQSFREINRLLTASKVPIFVVVDIRDNPKFPVTTTVTAALIGPYRNPNLRQWLVIGSNPTARFIERSLSSATGRALVKWFDTEAEAEAYIAEQIKQSNQLS